jgi:hypothetical protein
MSEKQQMGNDRITWDRMSLPGSFDGIRRPEIGDAAWSRKREEERVRIGAGLGEILRLNHHRINSSTGVS